MPTKKKSTTQVDRWMQLTSQMRLNFPHVGAFTEDEHSFRELRVKLREDGSCIGIAKSYGPDGGPLVCFGVGYGYIGALMALDAAIQGGNWRTDKPWKPSK